MRANDRSRGGFTITELLIASIITVIVISQSLLLLTSQQTVYVGQTNMVEIQSDTRLVMELMLNDVRMAGFLVPSMNAISGFDGGASNPDRMCVSDPSVIDDAVVVAAVGPLAGATLGAVLGNGAGTVNLVATSMDIDGDGDDDFDTDSGIILSNGTSHHCARITGAGGSGPNFAPVTPAGFSIPAGSRAVPAVIYELTGAGLMRNNVLLSSDVENLQFEYVVDLNGDGVVDPGEFPIHDVETRDPNEIKGVQISVRTRTANEDPQNLGSRMPRAANHDPGPQDNFLRRRFTANAVPRNN